MNEIEIINNFEKYIKSTDSKKFILKLKEDLNFSNFLINNNLFWKNLDYILNEYGSYVCFEIIELLCNSDTNNKFINEEMYTLFDCNYFNKIFYSSLLIFLENKGFVNEEKLKNIIEYDLKYKCKHINYNFINYLFESKYSDVVIDNFENILNNSYYLLDLKELIKNNNKLLNDYNIHVNNKPNNLIYGLLVRGFDKELEVIEKEKIFDTLRQIIDELLKHENLKYSDIDFIGDGSYNYVVSIGTKVLKLGKKRETFVIKNNKRFLKPILRTEINKLNSNEVLGCIEITEKVETENITEEEIYTVYKELRDEGYYWVDCRKTNVGRLVKNNEVHYKNLNPTINSINYTTENNETLSKGDIVIIDNDYIFSEEEFKKLPFETQENYIEGIEEYEMKYQEEKNSRRKL